jgi:hypothetical protein
MLFVGSMAHLIISAATLLYGAFAERVTPPTKLTALSDQALLQITNPIHLGLYGLNLPAATEDPYSTWTAPNLGLQARADEARDLFNKDIESAVGVFCFARNAPIQVAGLAQVNNNENRRINYTFPLARGVANNIPVNGITGLVDNTFGRIDTPSGFYNLIISNDNPGAGTRAATYLSPLDNTGEQVTEPNASIFIVGPTPGIISTTDRNVGNPANATQSLRILAIWEIDFIDLTTEEGILASVRRYSNSLVDVNGNPSIYALGEPTVEYSVIFSESNSYDTDLNVNSFGPVFRAYMRTLANQYNGPVPNNVRNPFYVIWWPDPASPNLISAINDTANGNVYRYINNNAAGTVISAGAVPATRVIGAQSQDHYGNTSYLMVAPMFPSLLQ